VEPARLERPVYLTLRQLAERYSLFGIQVPIASGPVEKVIEPCPDCRLIGERLDIRSRQSSKELKEMLVGGKLFELLVARGNLFFAALAGSYNDPFFSRDYPFSRMDRNCTREDSHEKIITCNPAAADSWLGRKKSV
jgi:hypothetical protein